MHISGCSDVEPENSQCLVKSPEGSKSSQIASEIRADSEYADWKVRNPETPANNVGTSLSGKSKKTNRTVPHRCRIYLPLMLLNIATPPHFVPEYFWNFFQRSQFYVRIAISHARPLVAARGPGNQPIQALFHTTTIPALSPPFFPSKMRKHNRFTMYRAPATGLKFMANFDTFFAAFFGEKKAAGRHIPPASAILRRRQARALCSGADVDHAISRVPATGLKFVPFSKRKMPPAGTYHLRLQFFVAAITFQGRPLFSHHGGADNNYTIYRVPASGPNSRLFSREKSRRQAHTAYECKFSLPPLPFKSGPCLRNTEAPRSGADVDYTKYCLPATGLNLPLLIPILVDLSAHAAQHHYHVNPCTPCNGATTQTSGAPPSKFDFWASRELDRGIASKFDFSTSRELGRGTDIRGIKIRYMVFPLHSRDRPRNPGPVFHFFLPPPRLQKLYPIFLEKSPPRAPTNMFSICRQAKYQSLDSELELAPPRLELYSTGERSSSTTGIKFNHTVK
ncbi:hypothetical protein C8R43DRAFT_957919 [Mycena crocata]|nr:hypothetical protein C8R43DRAFT_957919 [Mycena crocata]